MANERDAQTHTESPRAAADVYGEIVALARKSGSQSSFFSQSLRSIARSFSSPYAAVHVRFATEVVQDDWHLGPTDPRFWKAGVQRFLTDVLAEPRAHAQLLRSKSQNANVAFLASPIHDESGRSIGCLALVDTSVQDGDIEGRLRTLEAMVRLTSYSAAFVGMSKGRSSVVGGTAGGASGTAAKALARAAQCSGLEELAFALTNDLCNKLGCEQVALGMVRGSSVDVVSVSGMDSIHRQSPGIVCLRGAMEECFDADQILVCQTGENWADDNVGKGYRLHRQWQGAVRGDAVASIPLRMNEKGVAILSLRRRAEDPFSADLLERVSGMVEPFAPALVLTQRANRTLRRHVRDAVRGGVETLVRSGHVGAKLMTLCLTSFLLWFAFGSLNYSLTVPCMVRPETVRHVAAPFEGVLISAAVVEGDRVSKGDELCAMDRRELQQQQNELLAELAVQIRTQDRARADGQPVEVELARANQQLVQARLNLLQMRIDQATMLAPYDGVVVKGDLRKQIGAVVARGQPLYEIAPLDRWTLELYVPDHSSGDLGPDLSGHFASFARPDESAALAISRIVPQARVYDGRNVYLAEARVADPAVWMRSGLEGMARVQVGRRKVWWITLHRALDYLRMNFWL